MSTEREKLIVTPAIRAIGDYLDQIEHWEAQDHVIEELRSLVDDIPCCETGTAMPHGEHVATPVLDVEKVAAAIWEEQSNRALAGYVIHTRATAEATARAVVAALGTAGGEGREVAHEHQ